MANVPSQSMVDGGDEIVIASSVPSSAKVTDEALQRLVTVRLMGAKVSDKYIITPPLGVAASGPNKGKPVERWIEKRRVASFSVEPSKMVDGVWLSQVVVKAPAHVFTSRGIELPTAKAKEEAPKK